MDSPARKKNRTGTISTEDGNKPCRMGGDLKGAESFCPDETSIPTRHIPAPVWGHALDYMPYSEVRSALLICKTIAKEAVQHVQTVTFTKACQLDAPALRRFPNITEVRCLCLIHGDFSSTTLCEDTVFRIVPLLTALPRLERFFIGGMYNGQLHTPIRHIPVEVDTPSSLVTTLFYNFLGAFKGRLFASTLESTNLCTLFCSHYRHLGCNNTDRGLCRACKAICSYFPLRDAIKRCSLKIGCMKQSKAVVKSLEIIGKRGGAKDIFTQQQNSCCLLLLPFLRGLESFNFHKHPEEGNLLKRVLSNLSFKKYSFSKLPTVLFIPPLELEHLDRMIYLGIAPSAIPKNVICKVMHNRSNVMIKSTFDALVRRGFALDEEDFIVLDERVEPALQCVLGQLHERDEDADDDE